jgi:FMN phosphatase YigB (HAD superfamily)
MRKVPLLDLGNVLVKVDFTPFFQWLAKKNGTEDHEKYRSLLTSSLFYDFEFGNIRREEFAHRVGRLYGISLSVDELSEQFCGIFPGLVEGMESALTELAAVSPVYCLSNTNEIHLEYCLREYPALSLFTKIFASNEMRRRKPYPGIYRDVAHELGLPPEQLLFFDDLHANVRGALRAGLEAHVFDGVESFRARLKESGIMDDKVSYGGGT